MLRRRILLSVKKILRNYSKIFSIISNTIKTTAVSVPAAFVRLTSIPSVTNQLDSELYDASTTSLNAIPGAQPDVDPDSFDASNAYGMSGAAVEKTLDAYSQPVVPGVSQQKIVNEALLDAVDFSASVGCSKKNIHIENLTDALSYGSAVADVDKTIKIASVAESTSANSELTDINKTIRINNKTDALFADSQLSDLSVSTCDKPFMSAVACSKTYGEVDTDIVLNVQVNPVSVMGTNTRLESLIIGGICSNPDLINAASAQTSDTPVALSMGLDANNRNASSTSCTDNGSLRVDFKPGSHLVWAYQIGTTLYIRQAHDASLVDTALKIE